MQHKFHHPATAQLGIMVIYSSKIKLRGVASQAVYLVNFLMGGRNFISRVYSLASPV